jgi:hypothetical protein
VGEVEARVPAAELGGLTGVREPLERELPEWLEQAVTVALAVEEAALHEPLERVGSGVADLFGSRERAAAGEDRETREEPLLLVPEGVVAPLDRREHRLMARRRVPGSPGEQRQECIEAIE